jgi:putative spermidine/putrescine transport system ATP-binding protein
MSGLILDQVCKTYDGNRYVLDRLQFDVPQGKLVSLLGPSGCGKSTALRIIAGLIPASSGRIMVSGRDIGQLPTYSRNIGLVFQSYALFPHITVAGNVGFGLEMRGVKRREALHRAEEALEKMRLGGLGARMPAQLSGGQQQRVALARALVIKPDLLLLDEPLSNLDAQLREQMRIEIRELQQQSGITTVFVTHDQTEALAMSDHIAILDQGRIAQYGTPVEIYNEPANRFVASFIGRVNTFEGVAGAPQNGLTPIDCGEGSVFFTTRSIVTGPATLMIRPHRLRLVQPGASAGISNRLSATISAITFAGEGVQIAARSHGRLVVLECSSHDQSWRELSVGSVVTVEWAPAEAFAFAGHA